MSEPHDLALLIDRTLRRISAEVHTRAVIMDTERIGPFGGMVLLTLEEMEPAPMHQLVAQMARDKSQMTRVIATLERKGMIARHASPDDARVRLLSLTEPGRAFVDAVRAVMTEAVDVVFAPLTPEDRTTLAALLRRV